MSGGNSAHQQLSRPATTPQVKLAAQRGQCDSAFCRVAIRSGEESVLCSTALLRRGFTSADFS
jgi:hypothetical protein